jgi:hypothetical protein
MPRLIHSNPSYCRHKATGQAYVTIDGRDIYLGTYGAAASRAAYDRMIGQWLANGRCLPTEQPATISEVITAFWKHAQVYYRRPDGTQTGEANMFKYALRPLRRLYGATPANEFGPLALVAVRKFMVELGWCRTQTIRRTAFVTSSNGLSRRNWSSQALFKGFGPLKD